MLGSEVGMRDGLVQTKVQWLQPGDICCGSREEVVSINPCTIRGKYVLKLRKKDGRERLATWGARTTITVSRNG